MAFIDHPINMDAVTHIESQNHCEESGAEKGSSLHPDRMEGRRKLLLFKEESPQVININTPLLTAITYKLYHYRLYYYQNVISPSALFWKILKSGYGERVQGLGGGGGGVLLNHVK